MTDVLFMSMVLTLLKEIVKLFQKREATRGVLGKLDIL